MFLVRVVFWLTVVALLMPREPDVGLGVPGAEPGLSGLLPVSAAASDAMPDCQDYQAACEAGLAVVDNLQTAARNGLARIKTELERQKRQRGHL